MHPGLNLLAGDAGVQVGAGFNPAIIIAISDEASGYWCGAVQSDWFFTRIF